MHIVLAPFGTRRDVEPLLALGDALRARGHTCTLAAPRSFAAAAEREGMLFTSLGPGFDELVRGVHSEALVVRAMLRALPAQYAGLERAAREADAIVGAMMTLAGPSIAAQRGIPWLYAVFSRHYLRSRFVVPGGIPLRRMPPWLLGALNAVQDLFVPVGMRPWVVEERKRGFPSPPGVWPHLIGQHPLLLCYDEELLPTPTDVAGQLHRVGTLRRAASVDALPADLATFLDAGPAPVYLGFGSMSHRDPDALMRLLLGSVERTGVRAVINAGWSGLAADALPPQVLLVPHAPHDALFPRCRGVVHHGGAGTLHAAALAGVPQAIVHHWADQIHHGWRVEDLGIGPAPTKFKKLSPQWLDGAIRAMVDDPAMHARAPTLGERMRARLGGAERAADAVEQAVLGARR